MPEDEPKFRPASERDYMMINHVIEQAVMGWDLPERVKKLSVPSYYYHEHDFDHYLIVVAELAGEIIGVVAWEKQPITIRQSTKACLLHGIFVSPTHQKKGIGRKLFDYAVEDARKHDCDGLLVRAQKDAEAFFYRMDMKKLDVVDDRRDYAHRFWKPFNN